MRPLRPVEAVEMYRTRQSDSEKLWVEDCIHWISRCIKNRYVPGKALAIRFRFTSSPNYEDMEKQVKNAIEPYGWRVRFKNDGYWYEIQVVAEGDNIPKWWEFWKEKVIYGF